MGYAPGQTAGCTYVAGCLEEGDRGAPGLKPDLTFPIRDCQKGQAHAEIVVLWGQGFSAFTQSEGMPICVSKAYARQDWKTSRESHWMGGAPHRKAHYFGGERLYTQKAMQRHKPRLLPKYHMAYFAPPRKLC
jgi:hypothetical protein